MILNNLGQIYEYGPFRGSLRIGQEIVANRISPYMGLTGVIRQIIDGDDLETDNPGPDIYCDFNLEADENLLAASSVCERLGLKKEALLDSIILSPDMLEPKMTFQINPLAQQMYILTYYVNCPVENDDYMLHVSHDRELLKLKMEEHSEYNRYLKDASHLRTSEEEIDAVYRLFFEDDSGLYICYSIIPVDYE